ncbi:endogenous retrovirus group K member 6 Pro protein-like [Sorex araneus]|uniref:endogenous retrovirus group K member 6 Pro protein-like n=1 Tax=Sorex araneus TaxID=42254 RepID=UPI00243401B2|nr:endogenous retrovirus group K member 6 Pro protein-like [Sorex araneus]
MPEPSEASNTQEAPHVMWVRQLNDSRPMMILWLDGKPFRGLIDTGADATVLSRNFWPSAWPLSPTATHLQGTGQTQSTLQSAKILIWKDEDGNTGLVQPYVVENLPINLWGRDILSKMGLMMCSPNEMVTRQMLQQGYRPGKGLGRNEQGIKEPIELTPIIGRAGLGSDPNLFS